MFPAGGGRFLLELGSWELTEVTTGMPYVSGTHMNRKIKHKHTRISKLNLKINSDRKNVYRYTYINTLKVAKEVFDEIMSFCYKI